MPKKHAKRKPETQDFKGNTLWRRLGLAIPISVILHLAILLMMRPSYRDVADMPVDVAIMETAPGRPSAEEEVEEPQPPEPQEEVAPPKEKTPGPSPGPSPKKDAGVPKSAARADAGVSGDKRAAREDTGKDGGICFHNLFPFNQKKSRWLLWLSMASLRETSLHKHLAATLQSFTLGRNLADSSGINPSKDVEGLLVGARDILDPDSFRVVMSYDSGEGALRRNLEKKHGKNPSFAWAETASGYEAWIPKSHRWHMVGSGHVLVITSPSEKHATLTPTGTGASASSLAANAVPENPFSSDSKADAGPASSGPKQKGSFPNWPRQLTCLSATQRKKLKKGADPAEKPTIGDLEKTAKNYLGPDSTGRWPVALLTTSDPRAIGLGGPGMGQGITLELVRIRGFLSKPIRIEGEIFLRGEPKKIEALAAMWKQMAVRSGRDPFLAMAGLSRVFDKLHLTAAEDRIVFSIELTESQIRAALIFLQLQGENLDRYLKR